MILVALVCMQRQSQAQQPLAAQSSDASMGPLSYVNWVQGPQKASMGTIADINIPDGYRLADVHGARMILGTLNSPIPDDLAGILVPATGKWMATLEYSPSAYVKNPDVRQIDSKPVLTQILNQIEKQAQGSVTSMSWQTQPSYDAARHLLEWSLLVVTPTSKILNQTAAILGRHGVLQVTIAYPASLAGAPSLKQVAGYLAFKNGERYADYKVGDKIAEAGLAELISGEKQKQTPSAGFLNEHFSRLFGGRFGSAVAWTYSGLAACLLTGTVVVVRRRHRRLHRRHRRQHQLPVPGPTIKNTVPLNTVSANPAPVAIKNAESNGHGQSKLVSNHNHGNLARPFHRHRRRRSFDYPKFFTKVMRDMSSHYYVPVIMPNGKSWSKGHVNSHEKLDSNSNGSSNGSPAPTGMNNVNQAIKSEIEDLIATQKSLIQEQKFLMEQQTRLIEEKRQLMAEQSAILKNQSSLSLPPTDQQPFWPNQQAA